MMTAQQSSSNCLFRGSTIHFSTIFYDKDGAVTEPTGATLNLVAPGSAFGTVTTTSIPMDAPGLGATAWTADWDSRGAGAGVVFWSIHNVSAGIPYAVEDGNFELLANNANLVTF